MSGGLLTYENQQPTLNKLLLFFANGPKLDSFQQ